MQQIETDFYYMANPYDYDNTLMALVRMTFDAHSAVLFLPDQTGTYAMTLYSTEEPPMVHEVSIAPGRGLVGWILRHRQPVIVNNLDLRHSFLGYYAEDEEQEIISFMGCPLPEGGALCVDTIQPKSYTEQDQILLNRFASHISRQVRVAHLSDDAEELRLYFDRIEQILDLDTRYPQWGDYLSTFLNLVAESTGFDYVAFASSAEGSPTYTVEGENQPLLLDEENPIPELRLDNGGLVSWVFRNESPVHAEGGDGSINTPLYGKLSGVPIFQSMVCLPIQMNKITCGVLCLGGLQPRPLPHTLRTFIRMVSGQLSRHLETLYLRHRLKSLMPRAKIHRKGGIAYDPDAAPSPPMTEED